MRSTMFRPGTSRWSTTVKPVRSKSSLVDFTRPRGIVDRMVRPWSIPGNTRSSAYSARPVAFPIPSFRATLLPTAGMGACLEDRQRFHLEDQDGVRGNQVALRAISVGEVRRDDELSLTTDTHSEEAFLPGANRLVLPEGHRDLACIELLSGRQPSRVADDDTSASRCDCSVTGCQVLHVEARGSPAHRVEMDFQRGVEG